MTTRPSDEITAAVLDTILTVDVAEDGSVSRSALETAAAAVMPPNAALSRYRQDHPDGDLSPGEQVNAIDDGRSLLVAEAVSWLVQHEHLVAHEDRVRLGPKPLRTHVPGQSDKARIAYVPGTNRDEDLFRTSLRRVTAKRKKLIQESIELLGDWREFFPVLEDTNGDVIDGRHRRALYPDWPASPHRVPAADRNAVAVAANRSTAWDEEDWQRLRGLAEDQLGRQKASRKLAEAALLENHERSDREIAKLTGASPSTVGSVRSQLVSTVQIGQWAHPASKASHKVGAPVVPRSPVRTPEKDEQAVRLHAEGLSRAQIAAQIGYGENTVSRVLGEDRAKSEVIQLGSLLGSAPPQAPEIPLPGPVEVVHQHDWVRGRFCVECGEFEPDA